MKLISILLPLPLFASSLVELENEVHQDLKFINFPACSWRPENEEICDVVIIGGGTAGPCLAFALQQRGIFNVQIFDEAEEGKEGPWLTTARMLTLRSSKDYPGPALDFPRLTCQAWYTAQYGKEAWEQLDKVPTSVWGTYLQWYKKVLNLNVRNGWKLQTIAPDSEETFILSFKNGKTIKARKVVLATGRSGFGGFEIPSFAEQLPKSCWAHTAEMIDPSNFKDKNICILGNGASAFDAARFALEQGAKKVYMIMRRKELPSFGYFAALSTVGFNLGYFFLDDQERIDIFRKGLELGTPPPFESIELIEDHPSFELLADTLVQKTSFSNDKIFLDTSTGLLSADFLIFATGYAVDGSKQPELSFFFDQIKLWGDQLKGLTGKLSRFPYLGPHFEFLEKQPGAAPFLKNIYCFNYGAFLSHGRISGDIDVIQFGIKRLADGIALSFFLERQHKPVELLCEN